MIVSLNSGSTPVAAINEVLERAAADVRVTAASNRSVSLKEDFSPPLTLGYLGFDCEIRAGGLLGPPVPTHAVLNSMMLGEQRLRRNPEGRLVDDVLVNTIVTALREAAKSSDRVREALEEVDGLAKLVPPCYGDYRRSGNSGSYRYEVSNASGTGWTRFASYYGTLVGNRSILAEALEKASFELERSGRVETIDAGEERESLEEELVWIKKALGPGGVVEAPYAAVRSRAIDALFKYLYSPRD